MATKRDAEPGLIDTIIIVPVELAYEKPRPWLSWVCKHRGHKYQSLASRGWSTVREAGNYDHSGCTRCRREIFTVTEDRPLADDQMLEHFDTFNASNRAFEYLLDKVEPTYAAGRGVDSQK